MPGAQGIGPYSGKEAPSTMAVARELGRPPPCAGAGTEPSPGVIAFLVGVALTTTLIWLPMLVFTAHEAKS
jgi:hypothetical protein